MTRRTRRGLPELLEDEAAGERRGGRARARARSRPAGAADPPEAARAPARKPVARTPRQRDYLGAILGSEGVFGIGPAGSGKTYLAAAMGACMLAEGAVARMVVCRPTADAGEALGFLPGDLGQKLEPWMAPIFDAVDKAVGRRRRVAWQRAGLLEVCSFQHMQGRTFEDAFVLLDEAQNADNRQMETFLTRVGTGSRYVVAGDPYAQRVAPGAGGLDRALELARERGIPAPVVELGYEDIQRHEHARLWALAFHDDHARKKGK